MSAERITVTMPEEDVARLRQMAEATGAESVSAYVAASVRAQVSRDAALARLGEMWGELPDDALAWAEGTLGVGRAA